MKLSTEDQVFLGRCVYLAEQECLQPYEDGQFIYPNWWHKFDALPAKDQERYIEMAVRVIGDYFGMRATRRYILNCSSCGKFIPKSAIHADTGWDTPSGACSWECPHCGNSDANY